MNQEEVLARLRALGLCSDENTDCWVSGVYREDPYALPRTLWRLAVMDHRLDAERLAERLDVHEPLVMAALRRGVRYTVQAAEGAGCDARELAASTAAAPFDRGAVRDAAERLWAELADPGLGDVRSPRMHVIARDCAASLTRAACTGASYGTVASTVLALAVSLGVGFGPHGEWERQGHDLVRLEESVVRALYAVEVDDERR